MTDEQRADLTARRLREVLDYVDELLDIWEDGGRPHEHRVYVEGSLAAQMEALKRSRALAPSAEPRIISDPVIRVLVTKTPIQCRLCDDLATQIWYVPGGCVCATDPVQALCSQHGIKMEPLTSATMIFTLKVEDARGRILTL